MSSDSSEEEEGRQLFQEYDLKQEEEPHPTLKRLKKSKRDRKHKKKRHLK
jgi:hypothetical protein